MIRAPHTLILLPLALAACAAPTRQSAPVSEPPPAVHVPHIVVEPSAWETAGSEFAPSLRLVDEPRGHDLEFVFRYKGDGEVHVPERAVLPAGSTTVKLEQAFTAEPCGTDGQGVIEVYWPNPVVGEVLVAEWPVLHRTHIVTEVSAIHNDQLADPDQWAASYAIVVDLAQPEGEYAEGVRDCRTLQLHAEVQRQGKFQPAVQVQEDVTYESFPNLPREISLEGDRFVVVVSVAHPQAPALRRAYLKLTANVGGHEVTRHVPLRL